MENKKQFMCEFDYTGHSVDGNRIIVSTTGTAKIRIDLCYEDTVRVWADFSGKFTKSPSYAVEQETWELFDYDITDEGDYIKLHTNEMAIRINKNPIRIDFYKADNMTRISGELPTGGMGCREDGSVFMYNRLEEDEHFYGLGEDNDAYLGNLDRRGTSRDMVTGQTITEGYVTVDIPVTFFMSSGHNSNGYGMFVDNSYRMEFNMGKESEDYYFFDAEGGELIYYFMSGPSFKKILNSYTRLTGRPSMLPLWAFGFIQSSCTYKSWEELDEVIGTLRKKEIPMDCMVFDFDWPEYMMNFKWHPKFNGQSPEKIREHRANGVNFMVSNSGPMIKKESTNYQSGIDKGIFATDGTGNTVTCGHYGGDLMDFSAPNMKEWLWPQMQHLYDEGIRSWWLDLIEPEGDPIQTVYKGGSRAKIHNVFGLLNTKTYFEMQKDYDGASRPFILSRSGTAGIQKYGCSIWTGDVYSDYDTLKAHCPEALNTTMSGIPTWTSDTSGFISATYDNTTGTYIHLYKNDFSAQGRLYERWLQFSCFSPITRAHHVGPSSPYMFGELVENSCRHYLQLRYKLMPYIYSYAWETHNTGAPIMRALVFEYQEDEKVSNIKDEYMFGSELLVAPVLTENTTARKVYFPEGEWIDYDYGYIYEGNKTYNVYAPQNRIPLFVKAGAIIPMAPKMNYTAEKKWDPITLDIYPKGTSTFKLYCDDGNTMEFENSGEYTETEMICEEIKGKHINIKINESNKLFTPKEYEFNIHVNSVPAGVRVNGKILGSFPFLSPLNKAVEGWYFDNSSNILYVKIATGDGLSYKLEVSLTEKEFGRIVVPEVNICESEASETIKGKARTKLPYFLPPATVPCRIQLENYDRGGEGTAYHMNNQGNPGKQYRREDVNIELTADIGGGYNLFDITDGEWLEYTIHVTKTGTYNIGIRVATSDRSQSRSRSSSVHLEFDKKDVTGEMRLPIDLEKQKWTTINASNVKLKEGEQVMRICVDKGILNLNWIDISFLE